jgi:MoxR-like ATPase
MPAIGHFLALFEAVSRRDWKAVHQIGAVVAEEERKKKHYSAAHRLLEALEVATSGSGFDLVGDIASAQSALTTTPPELLHYEALDGIDEPILSSALKRNVTEFLSEWKSEKRLVEVGLKPRQTLLLYGPPGCGKSHLARYVARALEMRLFTVRFDSLISSFLGETGGNLRKIFEFVSLNRCVLFIDEIDAIAKLRDDKNELGELKRIVISLLQNLDLTKTQSLLIAATNHPHMLDPALWRRFQLVWELNTPPDSARELLIERYLKESLPKKLVKLIIDVSDGMTGSDLSTIGLSTLRKRLLSDSLDLSEALILSFIEHLKRHEGMNAVGRNDAKLLRLVLELRKSYGKYSYKELEILSGIPSSTLHSKASNSSERTT